MPNLFSILAPVIDSGLETRKIDLKREVDLSDKPRAAKFAKIVSALANTPGGTAYIVVGVKDRKERQNNDPLNYIVGFDADTADEFQRQVQQALENFLDPIPVVELRLIEYPGVNKTLGVLQIARSFKRPHRVKRDSGDVEQGVSLKRGSETRTATQDEITAMREVAQDSRLILNFVRPLTEPQTQQLREMLGALPETIDLPFAPVQFDNERPLAEQAQSVIDSVGLTLEEWSSLLLIVNLPALAPVAAAILAEMHGRSGHFPHVLRLKPKTEDRNVFDVAEIIKLQNIRDEARIRAIQPS